MSLSESIEDYLEAILVLNLEKGYCRSVDIARHLDVTRASVSRAIAQLQQKGYVCLNQDNFISLSVAGYAIASSVYERHCCLTRWLVAVGVSPEVASKDACRIEHVISDETFACLKLASQRSILHSPPHISFDTES